MTDELTLDTPEGDGQGYLSEDWLHLLRLSKLTPEQARCFLLEAFPAAVELMQPYALCRIGNSEDILGKPVKEIYFATGGWSGAEDLIEAMLEKTEFQFYHTQWKRGGAYWFEVPQD